MAAPLLAGLLGSGGALGSAGAIAGMGPQTIGGIGKAGMLDLGGRVAGLVGGIGGFITSGIQADTLRIRAKAAEAAAEFNAEQANLAAERVGKLADEQALQIAERGSDVDAQQKVAFAGQGVKVSTGAAVAARNRTQKIVAEDIDALKSNAFHQALGLKAQAFNHLNAGAVQAGNLRTQATNTLMSGGAGLAKSVMGAIKVV